MIVGYEHVQVACRFSVDLSPSHLFGAAVSLLIYLARGWTLGMWPSPRLLRAVLGVRDGGGRTTF
jgi:hypothetical protein